MTFRLVETTDSYDCETCGTSWAEGYKVYRDGALWLELKPVAHCYGGDNFTLADALQKIIEELGHTVTLVTT